MDRPFSTRSVIREDLEPGDVTFLMQTRTWPAVSITMNTTPAERMTAYDAGRLDLLLEHAEAELAAFDASSVAVLGPLRALVRDAQDGPTRQGVALFASRAVQAGYLLPSAPEARAVVEPTFATRDLVHALHRTPPHLLLVVDALVASLFRGYAGSLVPITDHGFPVQHRLRAGEEPGTDVDHADRYLRRVDAALAQARAHAPSPILVTGAGEPVRRLLRRSRHLHRLAGVLPESAAGSVESLVEAARVSLQEYLRSREEEALILLDQARRSSSLLVRSGVDDVWRAVHEMAPDILLVEEGLRHPASVIGSQLVPPAPGPSTRRHAPDGTRDDARYDIVDDLIELVIQRGGWVAFVGDGALGEHGGVALVLAKDQLGAS